MNPIYIGTSGYSYKDWRGILYPEVLPQSEYLKYYALQFPFVELNFSYYTMPSRNALMRLVQKTPKSFLFSIKAFKGLTHERTPDWKSQAELFLQNITPLAEYNQLAGVLIQLPYSFHYTEENRQYLASLLKALTSVPCFVEFRCSEWFTERVYEALDKRNAGLVMVDAPELRGLPSPQNLVTGGKAYIRMHGRNAQNWWEGDATSRYDYDYSDDELMSWIPKIFSMAQKAVLFIAFNNHARGNAVKNAKQLAALLHARTPA